jgi:glutamate formiminotransferase/formiminotetrahydrofolate cyclodeaminase
MERIVECVPNFSEGRDPALIKEITDAITSVAGIRLLDVDPGEDTNRTVVTFVGPPELIGEAAFRGARVATERIDMRTHHGAHPRFGATDVIPFVPVSGVTIEECADIARAVGERIGRELGVGVYLYEQAASRPERRNLARLREGEYEGLPKKLAQPEWAPDFGPAAFNPVSGVTAVGAREFLIAFNVNLNTMDRRYATDIAYELRERGRWKRSGNTDPFYYKGEVIDFPGDGTHPCGDCDFVGRDFAETAAHAEREHGVDLKARYEELEIDPADPKGPVYRSGRFAKVKGMGWVIDAYRCAQVTMNLTDYKVSPPHRVLEAAREEARRRGVEVTGTEIVGVVPYEAMRQAGRFYLQKMHKSTGLPVPDVVETAVRSMGLREVAPFDVAEKVLGLPRVEGPMVLKPTFDFVDEVSRDTPAPGGGSVAALAGALGAALAGMVANLSVGRGEFDAHYEELCELADRAQAVKDALVRGVDEDTRAFDSVLEALRLPKDTEEQKAERSRLIQSGYQQATLVPLATVAACLDALRLCHRMAALADPEMISDVGAGALIAQAGARAAGYNVRINLRHIKDRDFVERTRTELDALIGECADLTEAAAAQVERVLEGGKKKKAGRIED